MNKPKVFDYKGKETEQGCPTVMFNLSSDFKAAQCELAKFDEGLRALACSLGAGGYNAEILSSDELIGKVQWGIDNIVSVQEQRLTTAPPELAELQSTIARLTAENQRLKGGQGEPVVYAVFAENGNIRCWSRTNTATGLLVAAEDGAVITPLYASPPAPGSVVLPTRDAMRDLIAEVIGGDTYDCTRAWSAWSVGTMSEDDFVPLTDSEERLYELADACIDKVKELNQ